VFFFPRGLDRVGYGLSGTSQPGRSLPFLLSLATLILCQVVRWALRARLGTPSEVEMKTIMPCNSGREAGLPVHSISLVCRQCSIGGWIGLHQGAWGRSLYPGAPGLDPRHLARTSNRSIED
jgi:hypothetical protein